MSYCTLDEAFGNLQYNNVPKQNIQNNRYNSLNSCTKKIKTKRKRINCNEKKNRFDSNTKDLEINAYNPLKKSFELIDSIANSNSNYNSNSNSNSSTKKPLVLRKLPVLNYPFLNGKQTPGSEDHSSA